MNAAPATKLNNWLFYKHQNTYNIRNKDKNTPSTHIQQDNNSIAKNPEETYTAHRRNQEKGDRNETTGMESGIQMDQCTRGTAR